MSLAEGLAWLRVVRQCVEPLARVRLVRMGWGAWVLFPCEGGAVAVGRTLRVLP